MAVLTSAAVAHCYAPIVRPAVRTSEEGLVANHKCFIFSLTLNVILLRLSVGLVGRYTRGAVHGKRQRVWDFTWFSGSFFCG